MVGNKNRLPTLFFHSFLHASSKNNKLGRIGNSFSLPTKLSLLRLIKTELPPKDFNLPISWFRKIPALFILIIQKKCIIFLHPPFNEVSNRYLGITISTAIKSSHDIPKFAPFAGSILPTDTPCPIFAGLTHRCLIRADALILRFSSVGLNRMDSQSLIEDCF